MKKTLFCFLMSCGLLFVHGQDNTTNKGPWTLDDCIQYALEHNISIKQSQNTCQQRSIDLNTARNSVWPSLQANGNQGFNFGRGLSEDNTYTMNSTANTSFSIGGSLDLFTGLRVKNNITMGKLNLQAATADYEKAKDDIRIAVMQAFTQILYDSTHAKQLLNGGTNYTYFIGKQLKIGNSMYQIVGVYKAQDNMRNNDVYVPFTTMQMLTNNYNYEDHILFTFHGLNTVQENEEFERQYRAALNQSHRAAPDDDGAIWIWNRFTQNLQMDKGTSILRKALWIIGILTLLGGIVGVSNIMLITVKERTHEFGIRKAIGATPTSIMKLIVAESVTITALFGYIGMILGLIACEIMDATVGKSSLEMFGEKVSVFVDPTVGLDVAFGVTLVLIIAGTIAGLSPALKAARIRPIEALRNE